MRSRFLLAAAAVLLPALPQACADPLHPHYDDGEEIRLRVTGGLTGIDYTVVLNAATGLLLGESCVDLCDFTSGQVLANLTEEEVAHVFGLFQDAGILALDGRDFGVPCCDHAYIQLWYTDEAGSSTVRGSIAAYPKPLAHAISALKNYVWAQRPLVVDFEQEKSAWPHDPLGLGTPEISGDVLSLQVHYGGGCKAHRIEGGAWGGWMESDPVQVKVFLAHDDYDDPCDALVAQDLRFDLTPLKAAYQGVYGVRTPGGTTLRVLLEDPRLASPLGAWVLDYVF
jgi:hypothetical protein